MDSVELLGHVDPHDLRHRLGRLEAPQHDLGVGMAQIDEALGEVVLTGEEVGLVQLRVDI